MAEAYLKSLNLPGVNAISSGCVAEENRTENEPWLPKVKGLLKTHDIGNYAKTRSDQLTQELVDSADINICVNQIVKDICDKIVTMPHNTLVWDIVDTGEGNRILHPGDDDLKYTEQIFQELVANINQLLLSIHHK